MVQTSPSSTGERTAGGIAEKAFRALQLLWYYRKRKVFGQVPVPGSAGMVQMAQPAVER